MSFTFARRAQRMNPSVIREILKLTERPGVVSLAGGLPSADLFPVEAMRDATARVLHDAPREALQYAASEGFGPLREWLAAHLAAQGLQADPSQVLITTGSQQGLDLVAKVLIDAGSPVAVESPTYLGALQAFAPFEPTLIGLPGDDEGPLPDALAASRARFAYLLPNFQNPSGRQIGASRRSAIAAAAESAGVPLLEDNPYGDLWFDAPPPAPIAAAWPDGVIYLGSFSKVLVPGLRLGYVAAPNAAFPKLLQAKQAADLHTPIFNQRVVHELVKNGFLERHVPRIRARYALQRDAMQRALEQHLRDLPGGGCRWVKPRGGMFFWVTLPPALDAAALLPKAVERGVAYVPGAAFFADAPRPNTMRLSFVTVSSDRIEQAVRVLGELLREELDRAAAPVEAAAS